MTPGWGGSKRDIYIHSDESEFRNHFTDRNAYLPKPSSLRFSLTPWYIRIHEDERPSPVLSPMKKLAVGLQNRHTAAFYGSTYWLG